MDRSRRILIIVLCALFVVAIAARVSTIGREDSPYFKGTSAMAYRHMIAVSEGRSLNVHDAKAGHPDGYVPARYRASGMETITGIAYRAVSAVSDVDGRPFARRFTMFIASLCVFTAYGVASRLWNSRAAGLLAALLVAFEPALVAATNGRVFSHAIFASFFASLYAALALRALLDRSRVCLMLAPFVALVLLWSWEPARYGLGAWVVVASLAQSLDRRTRILFVVPMAAVILAAAILIPHLAATRAAGSWTTALVICAAVTALLPERVRRGWRAPAYLVAGTALITLLATPFRAGATEQFPALSYLFTRLRYLAGRPEPSLLSDWMRHLWSAEHAPLAAEHAIKLLIPVLLCALAWIVNREARAVRVRFVVSLALFAVACTAAVLDRSVLPFAALAIIVLIAGAAVGLQRRRWLPSGLLAVAVYSALSGVVMAGKAVDIPHQVARAAGVVSIDPATFVWISFENTDRELIRFISTRTSVGESVLAPEDLSAVLLAFSGRTSVQLPGTTSRETSQRHVELTRSLYRDEAALYEFCRRDLIDYVVYSVDVLLDRGEYSPQSMAGISALDPRSIAARMHFEPESLQHFTLIYENDHYRLFKVTASPQPIFLTDHPLFFQPALFVRDGRDIDHFRDHVIWLMVTYANAMTARVRGNAEESAKLLDTCTRQAPRFTRARLALADALMDLGRYEAARDQIAKVIEYAPDNATALYAAAFVQAQMGNREAAIPFLQLLAQTGDRAMIEKGSTLQYYLDHNIPLKPGAPQ